MPLHTIKSRIRDLYEGDTPRAHRFRYGLLAFDLAAVLFIVGSSFIERTATVEALDVVVGVVILADFSSRMLISRAPAKEVLHPTTWADIVAILSFLLPLTGEAAGFLRILRTLRLLHSYQLLWRLRTTSPLFRRHEEVILAATHLCVFLFIMTGLVYETQHATNKQISNYIDALYFTVTALTTTGFGDITLTGTTGRLLSVIIMFFGVTLFLRLAQVLFRPPKVLFPCPSCGLQRHDADAVHCKACGRTLNIPHDNL